MTSYIHWNGFPWSPRNINTPRSFSGDIQECTRCPQFSISAKFSFTKMVKRLYIYQHFIHQFEQCSVQNPYKNDYEDISLLWIANLGVNNWMVHSTQVTQNIQSQTQYMNISHPMDKRDQNTSTKMNGIIHRMGQRPFCWSIHHKNISIPRYRIQATQVQKHQHNKVWHMRYTISLWWATSLISWLKPSPVSAQMSITPNPLQKT